MSTTQAEAIFEDSSRLGAPEAVATSPWVVMKFGGTSVSSAASWETIAALVQSRLDAGLSPVVVHSALQGISNALEEVLEAAMSGDPGDRLERIRRQHFDLAATLGLVPLTIGVFAHEGSTVVVCLNSMRLLFWKGPRVD